MKVSKRFLLEFITRARTQGRYPKGAERLLGQSGFKFDLDALQKRAETWPDDERVPLADVLTDPFKNTLDAAFGHRLFIESLLMSAASTTDANPVIGGQFDAFGKAVVRTGLVVDGDLHAHKGCFLIVGGSLDVVGDIINEGVVVAAGGVRAGGAWLGRGADSITIVCGDMQLDRAILTAGQTFVGGSLSAPVIHIQNGSNTEYLKALGGLKARVAFEQDPASPQSRAFGEVVADVLSPPSLGGATGAVDEAKAIARLRELVASQDEIDWAKGLGGVMSQLAAGARKGTQVIRSEALLLDAVWP